MNPNAELCIRALEEKLDRLVCSALVGPSFNEQSVALKAAIQWVREAERDAERYGRFCGMMDDGAVDVTLTGGLTSHTLVLGADLDNYLDAAKELK